MWFRFGLEGTCSWDQRQRWVWFRFGLEGMCSWDQRQRWVWFRFGRGDVFMGPKAEGLFVLEVGVFIHR